MRQTNPRADMSHPSKLPTPRDGEAAVAAERWSSGLWPSSRAVSTTRASDPEAADPWSSFESEVVLAQPKTTRGLLPMWRLASTTRAAWLTLVVALLVLAGLVAWSVTRRAGVLTGTVSLSSEPSGAPVVIDGTEVGSTPVSLTLPSGSHQLSIGYPPHARAQTIVVADGRDAIVHVELSAGPPPAAASASRGTLVISSDPAGARVSIDGRARGIAPLTVTDVTPGAHTVAVTSARGTVTRTVNVAAGVSASVIVAMTEQSQFASGSLALKTPVPLQVFEDGTLLGSSDTPRLLLAAGSHTLDLVNTTLEFRVRRRIAIAAGQTTALTIEVPRGSININATPWAEVWIGGQSVGETPIGNLSLPIGTHELVFRHPELGETRRTVAVGTGAPARIGVDLRR